MIFQKAISSNPAVLPSQDLKWSRHSGVPSTSHVLDDWKTHPFQNSDVKVYLDYVDTCSLILNFSPTQWFTFPFQNWGPDVKKKRLSFGWVLLVHLHQTSSIVCHCADFKGCSWCGNCHEHLHCSDCSYKLSSRTIGLLFISTWKMKCWRCWIAWHPRHATCQMEQILKNSDH